MKKASPIALGGMLTAVALVIMSLGSLIPLNTYICPVLCILITRLVLNGCGKRIGWCYYGAVSVLALLLAPDREAALVYAMLGYYPMLKPWLDGRRFSLVWKLSLFTAMGAAEFALAVYILGIGEAVNGPLALVTLVVWDILLILVDRLLGMKFRKR